MLIPFCGIAMLDGPRGRIPDLFKPNAPQDLPAYTKIIKTQYRMLGHRGQYYMFQGLMVEKCSGHIGGYESRWT